MPEREQDLLAGGLGPHAAEMGGLAGQTPETPRLTSGSEYYAKLADELDKDWRGAKSSPDHVGLIMNLRRRAAEAGDNLVAPSGRHAGDSFEQGFRDQLRTAVEQTSEFLSSAPKPEQKGARLIAQTTSENLDHDQYTRALLAELSAVFGVEAPRLQPSGAAVVGTRLGDIELHLQRSQTQVADLNAGEPIAADNLQIFIDHRHSRH